MLDPPSQLDPANSNARNRQRICEEVTGSGFFEWYAMSPVNLNAIYTELTQPRYFDIFHQIYSPSGNTLPYKYNNPYNVKQFKVLDPMSMNFHIVDEFVFVCLLKQWASGDIVPFYVSKEYNVNLEETYKVGRFVFGENRFVVLAEETARAYSTSNFNLELHYLQMRKHRRPGKILCLRFRFV